MKIFKTICASILAATMAFSPNFNTNSIEKNIEVNENTFTITGTDFGQLNYIMWTKDSYICEIENGTYIQEFHDIYYDYVTVFLDENSTEVNIKLIPSGKFKENTEIVVFGDYYLMEETSINGTTIIGDINLNGKNDVADAVMLQKYILSQEDLNIIGYNRADLDRDGRVDAFDMILMRKKIIDNITS